MTEAAKRRLVVLPLALASAAGLAWAGSQDGVLVGRAPLFAVCVALSLAIQWVAFVPAYVAGTERYYDLTGSLTSVTVAAVAVGFASPVDARSWLLAILVVVWATRLGSFLFRRIVAEGGDRRFAGVKTSFGRFFMAWTLQGLWICFTMGAALAAVTSGRSQPLDILFWVGLLLWTIGFGIEVVADRQKSAFRARARNHGRFISSGLWAWSRHPNYFGEIVLWSGVALVALPALEGWQHVTLLSPVFVTFLLTRVSGIPLLEQHADAKWGGDPEYEAYKQVTPVLLLRPPR